MSNFDCLVCPSPLLNPPIRGPIAIRPPLIAHPIRSFLHELGMPWPLMPQLFHHKLLLIRATSYSLSCHPL